MKTSSFKSTRCTCRILMKLEFSRRIVGTVSHIKFHQNSSIESRVVPCGQIDGWTDMTKLIVTFRNFVKFVKHAKYIKASLQHKIKLQCAVLSSFLNIQILSKTKSPNFHILTFHYWTSNHTAYNIYIHFLLFVKTITTMWKLWIFSTTLKVFCLLFCGCKIYRLKWEI
jgi:hypothetical protein